MQLTAIMHNFSWDVPDSELSGYRISGKTKHDRIPDIRSFANTGYPAEYPLSGYPALNYRISGYELPDIQPLKLPDIHRKLINIY